MRGALKLADAGLLRADGFVGGAWLGAARRFAVRDPASGAEVAQVADLGPADTRRADGPRTC